MKKIAILVALFFAVMPAAKAQETVVVANTYNQLRLKFYTPAFDFDEVNLDGHTYSVLKADRYVPQGPVGQPALPVLLQRIEVPVCSGMQVEVVNAAYDTISAAALGMRSPIAPQQPAHFKSGRRRSGFALDTATYSTNAFGTAPLAGVRLLGTARDRRLAVLTYAPVRYNAVTGQLVVCRRAEIAITYAKPDPAATEALRSRYATPAFSAGTTLNTLPAAKAVRTAAPVRMTIVSAPEFRGHLDRFVAWKRLTGMIVDEVYTDEPQVGATTTSIAAYLKGLYTGATAASPAPTYVLLVGDNNTLPAFGTRLPRNYLADTMGVETHVTDLYYTTWTDDDLLPDCYLGRFSARTTDQLDAIVAKTLMYEQYTMPDPTYLDRAVLVAGVDYGYPGDNAYVYADPTMDYVAKTYVNAANGFSQVDYYKNDTAFRPDNVVVSGKSGAPGVPDTLRARYNAGAGWVNYSAHGDTNEWHRPNFNTAAVAAMTNVDKPMFMIGNCCLSNKFDCVEALSEALLRRADNAGAAAYIGATNSTLWEQDFEWSVGLRSNISGRMNATYDTSNLGMYDRLFHTHGEAWPLHATTAGAMIMAGNMQVETAGPQTVVEQHWGRTYTYYMRYPEYYWEIYSMQGDPSLQPWLTQADSTVLYFDSWIALHSTALTAYADPYAYVAVTDGDLNLVAAAWADRHGVANLNFEPLEAGQYTVCAILQGHKPRRQPLMVSSNGINPATTGQARLYPNPATSQVTVEAGGLRRVSLYNAVGQQVLSTAASGSSVQLSTRNLSRGVYFVRIATATSTQTLRLVLSE